MAKIKEEIYEEIPNLKKALSKIKQICEGDIACKRCPFYNGECMFRDIPLNWKIKD